MTTIIKANTIPEKVGNYDSFTKILEIKSNLRIYEGYSFTKEVIAIIPAYSDLTISLGILSFE